MIFNQKNVKLLKSIAKDFIIDSLKITNKGDKFLNFSLLTFFLIKKKFQKIVAPSFNQQKSFYRIRILFCSHIILSTSRAPPNFPRIKNQSIPVNLFGYRDTFSDVGT